MEADDIIEIMARQGMSDREWEQQTFAYIKIQRETARLMLSALTDEDYSVARLVQIGWRGKYGIIPGGMDNDPVPSWKPVYAEVTG